MCRLTRTRTEIGEFELEAVEQGDILLRDSTREPDQLLDSGCNRHKIDSPRTRKHICRHASSIRERRQRFIRLLSITPRRPNTVNPHLQASIHAPGVLPGKGEAHDSSPSRKACRWHAFRRHSNTQGTKRSAQPCIRPSLCPTSTHNANKANTRAHPGHIRGEHPQHRPWILTRSH